jgi:hypothetical protein
MALQSRRGTLLTVLEARAAVEPAIARLAADRRKDDDLAAMRDCLQRGEAAVGSDAFTEHDDRFAALVARAAGNTALALISDALRGISGSVRSDHDTPTQQWITQHRRALIEAIVARDSHGAFEAAETACTRLLDHQRGAEYLATRIVCGPISTKATTTSRTMTTPSITTETTTRHGRQRDRNRDHSVRHGEIYATRQPADIPHPHRRHAHNRRSSPSASRRGATTVVS